MAPVVPEPLVVVPVEPEFMPAPLAPELVEPVVLPAPVVPAAPEVSAMPPAVPAVPVVSVVVVVVVAPAPVVSVFLEQPATIRLEAARTAPAASRAVREDLGDIEQVSSACEWRSGPVGAARVQQPRSGLLVPKM
ncbi:hypothetical protein DJ021_15920 [Phenylobacterium hankyongense]|uniref:Uncharacterized protein n=1 Tax=Phenylobacterium hankyongense TaxID=1813876 RepID=A0A328B2P4_9CAUL|nr:hypothetical protein [Phenylobacterium hankyongense]RAK61189.1 hypothetical protein DJ021_15920 [Phenylobacterium hankyongense]